MSLLQLSPSLYLNVSTDFFFNHILMSPQLFAYIDMIALFMLCSYQLLYTKHGFIMCSFPKLRTVFGQVNIECEE